MTRAEIKKEAKESLKGRWGLAIGMILLYQIIVSGISMVASSIPGVGAIASLIITVPLSFGFIGQMIKFTRKENVGICDYFSIGFKNFGKSWSIVGHTLLKLLPVLIAYIVSAIAMGVSFALLIANELVSTVNVVEARNSLLLLFGVTLLAVIITLIMFMVKEYLYVLTQYIGNDNSGMSGKEVVIKSQEVMKGHRWEYFVLQLSFIGWMIVSMLTLGIGLLWLIPYMEVTNVKFYEHVISESGKDNAEVIVNN